MKKIFLLTFACILLLSSLTFADCFNDNATIQMTDYSALQGLASEYQTMNRQVFKYPHNTLPAGYTTNTTTIIKSYPYGAWLMSYIRIDNDENVSADVTVRVYSYGLSSCSFVNFTMNASETNRWMFLKPAKNTESSAINSFYAYIEIISNHNLTVRVFDWYFYSTDAWSIMTGKNNFCMPIYEETCFLPSETRQACTEFVKKNAWERIGGAYKNMFDSNVALWQIAYAMAQIMIIITIFILLPIYIIVWIKGRIERFRS